MRKPIVAVAVALGLPLAAASPAAADATYHTQRIPLLALGDAPGGGAVVNAHANGPVSYAHEIYTLQHAVPGTYEVVLNVYPSSLDCTGAPLTLITAQFDTNPAGNGQADTKFSPADVGGLSGSTVSAQWTVNGPATYQSDCSEITLD